MRDLIPFLIFISMTFLSCEGKGGESNGFGEEIQWAKNFSEGKSLAKLTETPLMLILHKSWCGACKNLKNEFLKSNEIKSLSKKFIMVNIGEEGDEEANKFSIDGQYIPRIYFFDSDGELLEKIINPDRNGEKYLYYYYKEQHVCDSMKEVLALQTLSTKEDSSDSPDKEDEIINDEL